MRRIDAGTERRLADGFARALRAPVAREVVVHGAFTAAFLLAAGALALAGGSSRPWDPALAAALVAALVVAARVEFSSGSGYAVPIQLVVVPMLLLLPTAFVPLLVALAYLLGGVLDGVRRRAPLARAPLAVADAWFALGPAVVLVALGADEPAWRHWPAYVAALAAQFAVELLVQPARISLAVGERVRDVARELGLVLRVDVLLAPIGLLAAVAAAGAPGTALLVLPLVALLAVLAREREQGIQHSLELGRAYRGTALLLRDVLEEDDEYTGRHTEDVVGLSVRVAERLGVDEDVRRAVELGALLHDIGKIAIPDAIINKPGPLDDAEWAVMRTHTIEGQRMLDQVGGLLADIGVVVRASHERWDGRGYPDGLAGAAIPLAARIVSACDAFNAMTTDRSYRAALPLATAAHELRANAGTQFDPRVVDALLAVVAAPPEPPRWRLELGGEPAGAGREPAALSPGAGARAPSPSPPRARSGRPPAR